MGKKGFFGYCPSGDRQECHHAGVQCLRRYYDCPGPNCENTHPVCCPVQNMKQTSTADSGNINRGLRCMLTNDERKKAQDHECVDVNPYSVSFPHTCHFLVNVWKNGDGCGDKHEHNFSGGLTTKQI